MTDTPQLLLAHHLKALRLPTFLREYDKLARQCAAEGDDHVRYLVRLTELELIDRERRMIERRIKLAKFPAVKSLDSFDFKAMPSLNKMLVRDERRQLPPEPEPKKTENATKHLTRVEQPSPWLTRWAHRHLPTLLRSA